MGKIHTTWVQKNFLPLINNKLIDTSLVENDIESILSNYIKANDYFLCFINGVVVKSSLPDSIEHKSVQNKLPQANDFNQELLDKHALENTCSIEITVAPNTQIEQPINCIYLFDDKLKDSSLFYKQSLIVGKGSKLKCIETVVSLSDNVTNANLLTQYYLHDRSECEVNYFQSNTAKLVISNMQYINQGKNSVFTKTNWLANGKVSYLPIVAELCGDNANFNLNSVINLNQDKKLYNPVNAYHHGKNTESKQRFCGIAQNTAQGLVDSRVFIGDKATKASAYQSLRGLLLDNFATLIMRPELEINTDDVSCNHGASCGALDPLGLSYLRSRGIEESHAKAMMMQALVRQVLPETISESLQDYLDALVKSWQGEFV